MTHYPSVIPTPLAVFPVPLPVIPAPLPVFPAQAGISHPRAASHTTIPGPLYHRLLERSGKAPNPTRILEARD